MEYGFVQTRYESGNDRDFSIARTTNRLTRNASCVDSSTDTTAQPFAHNAPTGVEEATEKQEHGGGKISKQMFLSAVCAVTEVLSWVRTLLEDRNSPSGAGKGLILWVLAIVLSAGTRKVSHNETISFVLFCGLSQETKCKWALLFLKALKDR
jgi:hypothetical protein